MISPALFEWGYFVMIQFISYNTQNTLLIHIRTNSPYLHRLLLTLYTYACRTGRRFLIYIWLTLYNPLSSLAQAQKKDYPSNEGQPFFTIYINIHLNGYVHSIHKVFPSYLRYHQELT